MKAGRWLTVLGVAAAMAGAGATHAPREWHFTVLLDGSTIGEHRFLVQGGATQREVTSRARMDVRLLGLTLYSYRHEAAERWEGDCLRALRATTDDDGSRRQVTQIYPDECLMSFAYWHPDLPRQTRLLNPQTGLVEPVRMQRQPPVTLQVRGRPREAQGWRIVTPAQAVTVWYAVDDGAWIGLDAEVSGGRQLAYRLR